MSLEPFCWLIAYELRWQPYERSPGGCNVSRYWAMNCVPFIMGCKYWLEGRAP